MRKQELARHSEIEGVRVSYLEEGVSNSKLVLFIHGWGGTKETWQPFLMPVAGKNFHTVAIDLPCFGESGSPRASWGVEDYSDFLQKLANKLTDKPVILVGRSFGARIAAKFAAEYGEKVEKLVLISAAGITDLTPTARIKKTVAKLGRLTISLLGSEGIKRKIRGFLYRIYGIREYGEAIGIRKDIFVKTAGFDLRPELPKIKIPTLLIWGENDNVTPVSDGRLMQKLIPNSKLVVLPNVGHQVHKESKERFLVELLGFIL